MKHLLLEAHYRILNLNISLCSDSKELLDRFDKDYEWFRRLSAPTSHNLRFMVELEGSGERFVRATGNDLDTAGPCSPSTVLHRSLMGHPSPVSCALQQIVRTLFCELTGFLVLHAAVVERAGRALVLSGPPGIGKSTLTLALLERGFGFLSDDFCPIDRVTRQVHPFPRSVWVTDRGGAEAAATGRPGKQPITPGRLPAAVYPSPADVSWLVCLDSGGNSGEIQLEAGLKDEGEQPFVHDMRGIDGVMLTRLSPDLAEWRIAYPAGKGLSSRVRRVIERHRDQIWNIYRSDRAHPDFDRTPALTLLAGHEAALAIMGELKQEPDFLRGGRDTVEGPGPFFAALLEILSGIACYRLTVGRLEETVRRIEELTA